MLEALGLGIDEESVYREMLASPHGGVEELADRVGMPESCIRDALDRLVDMGLIATSRDSVGGLRAVSPEVGLEVMIRRQEEELARRQEELARSKAAVARTVAMYAHLRPNIEIDQAERLVGLDAIQNRLEILTRELSQECMSIIPGAAQSQRSMEASRPLDEAAMARGVHLRAVYQDSARHDGPTLAYAKWTTERGGLVRTSALLPPRMLIFDRRVALVPIDPENSKRGALCTSAPGIVASLVSLFQQTWETSVPLGNDHRSPGEDSISAGDRDLLRLLASGMTDEAAGKRLGVSMRTVRRQMASLMERLNASSRFEAGLKAAHRGWL
ncbi:helix-turn-helix domain-containing protein [Streptomyces virginiae]|uniref:helix-turn-helix transcriptional regulator n=1 Tax=Streptomyces virginiae TaxID=1961 RepID=UPI00363A36A3